MVNTRIVEHHIKYKEIHGYDETVMMSHSEHIKLHNRLRKEGKCNISVKELKKISDKAHSRTTKAIQKQREYYKNLSTKQKKRRKEYNTEYKKNNKENAAIYDKIYREQHKTKLAEYKREYGKKYREQHKTEAAEYQKSIESNIK